MRSMLVGSNIIDDNLNDLKLTNYSEEIKYLLLIIVLLFQRNTISRNLQITFPKRDTLTTTITRSNGFSSTFT